MKLEQWEIGKILGKNLHYSWRKPQIKPIDSVRQDVLENRVVFKAFIKAASANGAGFIFVDESHFNPRKLGYRSWISKTNPAPVLQLNYSKGVAAMCALTDQGVLYSVLGKGTNSHGETLLFFIDLEGSLKEKEGKLFNDYGKKLIIIFDNASIHCHELIVNFFGMRGVQAVTLPQYTPEWNPLEKVFGLVKT